MSTTKSSGSTKLGRDSQPKYLGVKLYQGQKTKTGSIIIRQRGTKFVAGKNVRRGKDDTLYAIKTGTVKFRVLSKIGFNGKKKLVKAVDVI
jgi:large subunit ribosomal protein L27